MVPKTEGVMVMKPAMEERTVMKPEIETHTVLKPVTETKKVLKEEMETREVIQTKMVTRPVVSEKVIAGSIAAGGSKTEVKDLGTKVESLGVKTGGIVSDTITARTQVSTAQVQSASIGGNRVLICLTSSSPTINGHASGAWFSEAFEPFEIFTKAGYECDFCTLTGHYEWDSQSISSSNMDKEVSKGFNDKKHPIFGRLEKVFKPSELNPGSYSAVFFSGGHAAMWDFPTATPLQQVAAQVYERGGVIGAVCHGVCIFADLRLSNGQLLANGKQVTGFSTRGEEKLGCLDELTHKYGLRTSQAMCEGCGAVWKEIPGDCCKEFVVEDSRIITGTNPASSRGIAFKMLNHLHQIAPTSQPSGGIGVIEQDTTITKERAVAQSEIKAPLRT
jgi:putative intracellular protease/amidase